MKAIADPRFSSANEKVAKVFDPSKTIRHIRQLIWLYLFLLIFEGVLRKWILPQFSAPLLIVRDPVVIAIYMLAWRARIFPSNALVIILEIIAILSWATGIIVLLPYLSIKTIILVTGYGVRSNFLHLPLLFIIPSVFNLEDVKRIGWWTILGMIPMAVLMALQFAAAPEAFINRAVGLGEGTQIAAGGGKIRPPAVFSFISGAVYYLSTTAAFLLHAVLAKLPYKTWVLCTSGAGLIVGMGVSGSRSAVLAVGVVLASLALILLIRPQAVNRFGRQLLLAAVVIWAISYLPIFREGVGILSDRFTESAEEVSVVRGLVERTVSGFTEGLLMLDKVPLGGYGLGVGTSGGASFLTGRAAFLLAENEWSRILLESGPILGFAFLAWRCAVTLKIGWFAVRQIGQGNILPILLYGAAFFVLLEGPFGQPTSLGFAVVLGGLCLAARLVEKDEDASSEPLKAANEPPLALRRSAYAERLHGHGPRAHPHNGSLDR